jgi:hypothetical protein
MSALISEATCMTASLAEIRHFPAQDLEVAKQWAMKRS